MLRESFEAKETDVWSGWENVFDFHSLLFGWRGSFLHNEWVRSGRDFFPKARIPKDGLHLSFSLFLNSWVKGLDKGPLEHRLHRLEIIYLLVAVSLAPRRMADTSIE